MSFRPNETIRLTYVASWTWYWKPYIWNIMSGTCVKAGHKEKYRKKKYLMKFVYAKMGTLNGETQRSPFSARLGWSIDKFLCRIRNLPRAINRREIRDRLVFYPNTLLNVAHASTFRLLIYEEYMALMHLYMFVRCRVSKRTEKRADVTNRFELMC